MCSKKDNHCNAKTKDEEDIRLRHFFRNPTAKKTALSAELKRETADERERIRPRETERERRRKKRTLFLTLSGEV